MESSPQTILTSTPADIQDALKYNHSEPYTVEWNQSFLLNKDKCREDLECIMQRCETGISAEIWWWIKVILTVNGLIANSKLLWVFIKGRRSLSVSQILGVNLTTLNLLYLLCLPLSLYSSVVKIPEPGSNIAEAIVSLNVFGCPLLLACMCVERYLAAAQPITYLALKKWEYRVGCSTVIWLLCLLMFLLVFRLSLVVMMTPFSVMMSSFFLVMLACLAGIVWVLCRRSPAKSHEGTVSVKRRALKNILMVLGQATVAYLPILLLQPIIYIKNEVDCNLFQILIGFPNFGVFIGPTFYLSQVSQLRCCKKKGENVGQTEMTH